MSRILDRLLTPILAKLDGWKTIVGVLALLAISIAHKMAWIDAETANDLWQYAVVAFALGIASKDAKRVVKNGNQS